MTGYFPRSGLMGASLGATVALFVLGVQAWGQSPPLAFPAGVAATIAPPSAANASAPTGTLPTAIYWKQDLFLIPYHGNSNASAAAAESVRLFVSADRGTTWQTLCEAKPNVKAFNYRAPGDGEYWFAVQNVDGTGRAWPAGALRPDLRVIVDKTPPTAGTCGAVVQADGVLHITWSAADAGLDPNSWRWEVQTEGGTGWEGVVLANVKADAASQNSGNGEWRSPVGRRPTAVRTTVSDRAGNVTTLNVPVTAGAAMHAIARIAEPVPQWTSATSGSLIVTTPQMAATSIPYAQSAGGETQAWPASLSANTPYRIFDNVAQAQADTATRYGNPSRLASAADSGTPLDRAASDGRASTGPVEPFRQASVRRLPPVPQSAGDAEPQSASSQQLGNGRPSTPAATLPRGVQSKQVASRTFELDYHFENLGRWGISRVELWGTRNGGRTWRRYTEDEDLRSPVQVTVEGEGRFGFCIVAEAAGGTPPTAPQAGDSPELWVDVDLHRPYAELTSVVPGSGNQADQLVLRWRADDENLEPRPVSLFYSSRPVGPWSAIATNLENTGEYTWRTERYVPERCYLRLEVRDAAGNVGAFQTIEPISLDLRDPSARMRPVAPVDAEAAARSAIQRWLKMREVTV